jgi:hypothetical protein
MALAASAPAWRHSFRPQSELPRDAERLVSVYRPLSMVLAIGAVAALVVGWVRPAPWLLALLLLAVLSVLWAFAMLRFLWADDGGEAPAAAE